MDRCRAVEKVIDTLPLGLNPSSRHIYIYKQRKGLRLEQRVFAFLHSGLPGHLSSYGVNPFVITTISTPKPFRNSIDQIAQDVL